MSSRKEETETSVSDGRINCFAIFNESRWV